MPTCEGSGKHTRTDGSCDRCFRQNVRGNGGIAIEHDYQEYDPKIHGLWQDRLMALSERALRETGEWLAQFKK